MSEEKKKIILDTDIGDDIDDAYALAFILASEEFELLGVTTVFGNTHRRAQQAQTILKLAGREDIPVAVGSPGTLSPKLKMEVNPVSNYLQDVKPSQHGSALPETQLPDPSDLAGPEFIIQSILDGDGDINVITIGAMTNLALALIQEPNIIEYIPRIVSMAGVFNMENAEWNIACDPVAAQVVFNSGIPMSVIGLDVTIPCCFKQEHLDRLNKSESSMGKNLAQATDSWPGEFPTLHDPLALETMLECNPVQFENGRVTVELYDDASYGFTKFVPSPDGENGPHDIGRKVDSDLAIDLWLDRVLK